MTKEDWKALKPGDVIRHKDGLYGPTVVEEVRDGCLIWRSPFGGLYDTISRFHEGCELVSKGEEK